LIGIGADAARSNAHPDDRAAAMSTRENSANLLKQQRREIGDIVRNSRRRRRQIHSIPTTAHHVARHNGRRRARRTQDRLERALIRHERSLPGCATVAHHTLNVSGPVRPRTWGYDGVSAVVRWPRRDAARGCRRASYQGCVRGLPRSRVCWAQIGLRSLHVGPARRSCVATASRQASSAVSGAYPWSAIPGQLE
jgi:hypothetical protein